MRRCVPNKLPGFTDAAGEGTIHVDWEAVSSRLGAYITDLGNLGTHLGFGPVKDIHPGGGYTGL